MKTLPINIPTPSDAKNYYASGMAKFKAKAQAAKAQRAQTQAKREALDALAERMLKERDDE